MELHHISKNNQQTQRIVVGVESWGGQPLESCAGNRTTPDAGTSSSTHDDPRHGDIGVPTSTPSAAAATAAVCRIQLPQRQDANPSSPVFVEIGGCSREFLMKQPSPPLSRPG